MHIREEDRPVALAALYNNASPVGLGMFAPNVHTAMTVDEAAGLLQRTQRFDYVRGRPLKVDMSGTEVRTFAYNRDHGEGAAERVVRDALAGACNG